ncbi:GntR family transcriptional regulator [Polaribacter reichenbachii]|uniref:GntR family transcriptional regulator n=1 Tax=Polaribacter reichenbachii TaxID=996801 RepID=A0A1B8TUF3_9FLAO|nr:GntR family transcriptional regulator [Polaribacter reichenbachii]APZ45547.1 GntR family transcriptional regulator [Polaribacter reichenbachii]AUC19409.1 GntR family transcriptional regulator [Polaribacter reichenbachii]OBY63436.1 GntR family transcriptional regulator [Polaribacter reichenbachii]
MDKTNFYFKINHQSDIPKYQQIVNAINDAIAENLFVIGDAIPSVNKICAATQLSRDTVFKAYSILKENGVIESVPNKGYYIANETKKVLLVLDTFKAYKEVVYHSFVQNLSENIIVDLQFHHYNIDNFKTILNNSKGKYYKYVVMPFNHNDVPEVIADIDNDKLLLIDWSVHSISNNNYVFQDFGQSFFEALKGATEAFSKYKELVFLYPTFTYHPIETVDYFKEYCALNNFNYRIVTDPKTFKVHKNTAYISTSDRMLGRFLEQSKEKNYEPGKDVGFLSYNETPMKKFIYKGISVISTDFKELGTKAAEFVMQDKLMQHYVPTKLTLRESL